jgi:hypothetical protein
LGTEATVVVSGGLVSANLFAHITAGTNTAADATNGGYPSVNLTGGSGSGAVVTVTVSSSIVSAIAVTSAGSGYVVGDVLTIPAKFASNTGSARTITLQANDFVQTTGEIKSITVTNAGTGHLPDNTLTFVKSVGGKTFGSSSGGAITLKIPSNPVSVTLPASMVDYQPSPRASDFTAPNTYTSVGTTTTGNGSGTL